MKQIIFALSGIALVLAGCQSTPTEVYEEYPEPEYVSECAGSDCAIVRYASPNGNDLVLETDHHVIQVSAQTNVPYKYYVWAGNKTTADDPDMIIQDGQTMILAEEEQAE
jgi:ABC-type uncharacterized transport system auxiliary subunit